MSATDESQRSYAAVTRPSILDTVSRNTTPNEINEVRVEVFETLGRESDTELAKVAWLGRRDDLKVYGSMVVYFKKRPEAKEFIGEGLSWLEESSTPQECLNVATA
ncbi:hypothetical protein BFJ68_g17082 [Fusarium oxysporum]|uniref:Uncharacterized protein n=3 Tax=Fusarium oxysporum TaxID=5507 RepID=A0A420P364_FUSOX|nr:hypothetical protein BFJ68_g17082 [Fusarium oxysporum]